MVKMISQQFIALQIIFLLIWNSAFIFASNLSIPVKCGDGWHYNPLTGFCYGTGIDTEKQTWDNAENYCKRQGGHLVTVHNIHEYREFMSNFYITFENNWMGYFTDGGSIWDPLKWKSVDGKPINFLKFGRWCNTVRWSTIVQPSGGKRCLSIGWDQEKSCVFDLDCNGITARVVCKRPPPKVAAETATSLASISAAEAGAYDCGLGWHYYPPTGSCYGVGPWPATESWPHLWEIGKPWTNAQSHCQSFGGHLITINSMQEYQLFLSYYHILIKPGIWTGYYTDGGTTFDETKWKSIDGKPTDFMKFGGKWCNTFRWGAHVPPSGGKRCLSMGWDQEKACFFDVDCTAQRMRVLCERSPKPSEKYHPIAQALPAPTYAETFKCGEGYSYYPPTGYCYGVGKNSVKRSWEASESECQNQGGHLVTINSVDEYRQILSYFYVTWYNTWTGYYTEEGTTDDATKWIGVDGKEVNILKFGGKWCNTFRWGAHVPPSGGKRCLSIGWDEEKACIFDLDCAYLAFTLCQRLPAAKELINSAALALPSLMDVEMYDCGTGWSYYPPTGYCYGVQEVPQKATWTNAENYCQSLGAHLITINSLDEYHHVFSYEYFLLLDNLWVGYSAEGGTTFDPIKWKAVDGKEVSFLKYGKWCNTFRWGTWVQNYAGTRCLALGYDQEKVCFFNLDCTASPARIMCKRLPKEEEKIRTPGTVSVSVSLSTKASVTIPPIKVIERKTCYV